MFDSVFIQQANLDSENLYLKYNYLSRVCILGIESENFRRKFHPLAALK